MSGKGMLVDSKKEWTVWVRNYEEEEVQQAAAPIKASERAAWVRISEGGREGGGGGGRGAHQGMSSAFLGPCLPALLSLNTCESF